MDKLESLSHTKWDCKFHVVFVLCDDTYVVEQGRQDRDFIVRHTRGFDDAV